MEKIGLWIKKKFGETVFGEASRGLKNLYKRNAVAFAFEMIVVYLLSIWIVGSIILFFGYNLGNGNEYPYSIANVLTVWFNKGVIWSVLLFCFVQILIFKAIRIFKVGYKRDKRGGYDISTETPYGDADFMNPETMRKRFQVAPIEENKQTIFGRDPDNLKNLVSQKPSIRKLNRNVFICAGPSAGKSACFIIPLLLQIIRRGESAIVSDPKSELFAITSEIAKYNGYEVRILNLNPMFIKHSDPCNFLEYVNGDVDKAQVVANAIINTTTNADETGDFWTEGALNFLQALILYISCGDIYKENEKNLPQLFTYITTHDLTQIDSDFEYIPEGHPAKAPYKIFKDGKDDVRKQVLQGLGIKLKLFNSPALRRVLSETVGGIDVVNPGRKRCMYFVGSNDQDSSMDSIVSLFYTLEYQELVRYADARADRELPVKVHMVLDEYANMAAIPSFEKKLSTVRSRGIITYIVTQDINQLATKHPCDTWRTVLNDCDYYVLLKTSDHTTMDWWAELSGEQTKSVKNKMYEKSKTDVLGIHKMERISEGIGTGTVLTKHQVRTVKDDELYVLQASQNMLLLKTFFWKDHPYAKYITDDVQPLPAQHLPLWWLVENGVVGEDYEYDRMPSIIMKPEEDEALQIDKDYDPDKAMKVTSPVTSIFVKIKEKAHKEKKAKEKPMPMEERLFYVRTIDSDGIIRNPDGKKVSRKRLEKENLKIKEKLQKKAQAQKKAQKERIVKEKEEKRSAPHEEEEVKPRVHKKRPEADGEEKKVKKPPKKERTEPEKESHRPSPPAPKKEEEKPGLSDFIDDVDEADSLGDAEEL